MYIDSLGFSGGMGIKTMKAFSRQKGKALFIFREERALFSFVLLLSAFPSVCIFVYGPWGVAFARAKVYATIVRLY